MPSNWIRSLVSVVLVGYLTLPTMSVIANSAEPRLDYRLGPQDKIAVKVYEWRPSRDEVYEWIAFKAEHAIDSSGSLSLPLVGQIVAKGMTTTELAQDVGERLKKRMGLIESPDITVEIVQFRPFYVVGAVDKPGEYPYRPDLTVLKAYAIAGGKPRSTSGLARLEREAIATRGDIESFDLEGQTLVIRLARLRAELNDDASVEWPAELKPRIEAGPLSRVAQQEQLLFRTRKESFGTQLTALEQLQTYLDGEVKSLEKQVELHKVEAASVKTESQMVSDLFKKGLAIASRKLALERNVAQVDGDRLRLESSLMRARQEISKTKISIIDLKAKRSSEISGEMQAAQAKLEGVRGRAYTAMRLLAETENLAPQFYADQERAHEMRPLFKIVRDGETLGSGGVTEATSIEPGDTLIVEAPARSPLAPALNMDAGTASSAPLRQISDRLR